MSRNRSKETNPLENIILVVGYRFKLISHQEPFLINRKKNGYDHSLLKTT